MSIAHIAGAIALVGTIAGGVYVVEDRYAHKADHVELAGSVSRQFLEIRLDTLRQRLWYLRDRAGCQGPVARECRYLEQEIERIKRRLRR